MRNSVLARLALVAQLVCHSAADISAGTVQEVQLELEVYAFAVNEVEMLSCALPTCPPTAKGRASHEPASGGDGTEVHRCAGSSGACFRVCRAYQHHMLEIGGAWAPAPRWGLHKRLRPGHPLT